jgi:hypothetical protein
MGILMATFSMGAQIYTWGMLETQLGVIYESAGRALNDDSIRARVPNRAMKYRYRDPSASTISRIVTLEFGSPRLFKNAGSLFFFASNTAMRGPCATTSGRKEDEIAINVKTRQAIFSACVGKIKFHLSQVSASRALLS